MTNKKKTSTNKQRKQQQQQQEAKKAEPMGPALPPSEPVQYTRAQLTALVFFALGASRFLEWQRALNQMTGDPQGNNNGTATICRDYILTNDEVDFDSVCDSPVTYTLVSLKYDVSIQLLVVALFLMVQVWADETLLNRLNAFLTLTPVSTTLLLLQSCRPWITPRRSMMMTIAQSILMFIAFPATGSVLREFRHSWQTGKTSASSSTGVFVSVAMASMTFLNLFEAWQWYATSIYHQAAESYILNASTLTEWNEAWKVFLYTLMLDKVTMAAILVCVWTCFDQGRQRSFLLVWGLVKLYEYLVTWSSYEETKFASLDTLKYMALTCTVLSGVAWLAPNGPFRADNTEKMAGPTNKAPKIKAV